jgi:hypothetical protein
MFVWLISHQPAVLFSQQSASSAFLSKQIYFASYFGGIMKKKIGGKLMLIREGDQPK